MKISHHTTAQRDNKPAPQHTYSRHTEKRIIKEKCIKLI
jgi:hypothetical protein